MQRGDLLAGGRFLFGGLLGDPADDPGCERRRDGADHGDPGDHEEGGDGASGSRRGDVVAVADRGDGDECPPQGLGEARDRRPGRVLLRVERRQSPHVGQEDRRSRRVHGDLPAQGKARGPLQDADRGGQAQEAQGSEQGKGDDGQVEQVVGEPAPPIGGQAEPDSVVGGEDGPHDVDGGLRREMAASAQVPDHLHRVDGQEQDRGEGQRPLGDPLPPGEPRIRRLRQAEGGCRTGGSLRSGSAGGCPCWGPGGCRRSHAAHTRILTGIRRPGVRRGFELSEPAFDRSAGAFSLFSVQCSVFSVWRRTNLFDRKRLSPFLLKCYNK